MLLVLVGPRTFPGGPEWSPPFAPQRQVIGAILVAAGGAFFLAGLTAGLRADTAALSQRGRGPRADRPFSLVRHPIYCGGLIASFGVALMVSGWLTFLYVAALFALLDVKSRQEERWLVQKFPEYAAYQRRVRKLIPFLY